jgi:hypothetical protein
MTRLALLFVFATVGTAAAQTPAAPWADQLSDPGTVTATAPPPLAPSGGPALRALVVDAATFGIDPVVGRVASTTMRESAATLGYEVVSPEDTLTAARRLRMPYPPTPADLWRVSWVARAHRGVFARIWAHAGEYVIEVTGASLDGSGPFFERGTSGADDLREVVQTLTEAALRPPGTWDARGAAAVGGTPAPGGPVQPAVPGDVAAEEDFEVTGQAPPVDERSTFRRFSLTLQTEGAFGASSDFFYNHLVGVRFDVRLTRDILIGASIAYANLNGRDEDGRADNILFLAQFEDRVRIGRNLDLTLPLRAGLGYLPFNGPVLRLSAGLNLAVSPQWEIGADLVAPTFWFLPASVAVTLNVGLEATYRF